MKNLTNEDTLWDTYSFSLKTEELGNIKKQIQDYVFTKGENVSIFEISKTTTTLASGEVRHYFTVFYTIHEYI